MNEPRCDMGLTGSRCRNQAAGHWIIADKRIALCEDDRLTLLDQRIDVDEDGWEPLHPDPVQFRIASRLERMAQGAFG